MVCDVITWRHKGKTIKYRPFRRSKWQKFYNHSCVIHQMKDIYSEISNIFKFWSMTSSRDVIKEKLQNIAVLGDWSSNSFATIVVWYIKWKVFIQTFLIFLYFWSLTSSCDVIKEKLLNIDILGYLSWNNSSIIVVWYIKWKVFIQSF